MEGGREGGISLTSFYDKSDNDVEISSIDRFSDKEDSRYNFYRVNDLSQIYIYIYIRFDVFEAKHVIKTMYAEEQFPFGGN